MGDPSLEQLIPMIDAIVSASNPDEVSPKKIRKAIQELFTMNLDDKRKALNELIVERFQDIQEHPRMLVRKDEMLKRDQEFAKQLQAAEQLAAAAERGEKRTRQSSHKSEKTSKKSGKVKKAHKKRAPSSGTTSIATKPYILSEPLAELLGQKELPRTQVVKGVWDYIKAHDLQNPEDRREILCDDKMRKVFGKTVTMFSMNKVLVDHLFNPEEVKSDPGAAGHAASGDSVKSEASTAPELPIAQ